MTRPRRLAALALAVAVPLAGAVAMLSADDAAAGSGSSTSAAPHTAAVPASARTTPPRSGVVQVMALGDSVPAASGCDCAGFVHDVANALADRAGAMTLIDNLAADGYTSADVLDQLTDPQVRAEVAASDVVILEVGANDFDEGIADDPQCLTDTNACFQPELDELTQNLDTIVADLSDLAAPGARIVVVGYWNVFEEDVLGLGYSETYLSISDALTQQVNEVTESIAADHGVHYADAYTPFQGVVGEEPAQLLLDDGDHPNALGHQMLAQAVLTALDGA